MDTNCAIQASQIYLALTSIMPKTIDILANLSQTRFISAIKQSIHQLDKTHCMSSHSACAHHLITPPMLGKFTERQWFKNSLPWRH